MQWLRCSEDGTSPREELSGAALEALAVEAVVLRLEAEVWMEVVCVESHCSQVCLLELLEGQVVLALDSPELVAPHLLQGRLPLGSAYHHGLGTWPTWSLLATPAVQRSKSGRVTNAKAKIQI